MHITKHLFQRNTHIYMAICCGMFNSFKPALNILNGNNIKAM